MPMSLRPRPPRGDPDTLVLGVVAVLGLVIPIVLFIIIALLVIIVLVAMMGGMSSALVHVTLSFISPLHLLLLHLQNCHLVRHLQQQLQRLVCLVVLL